VLTASLSWHFYAKLNKENFSSPGKILLACSILKTFIPNNFLQNEVQDEL
jgi:hypothetical protein